MGVYVKKIPIDTSIKVLSARTSVYKTEKCHFDITKITAHDNFLLTLSSGIIPIIDELKKQGNVFSIVLHGKHEFYFGIGLSGTKKDDITFLKYTSKTEVLFNDSRFLYYLDGDKSFEAVVTKTYVTPSESELKKIYRVTSTDKASFPLLSNEQLEIVETEDKNMLVQGVAGSGKTNVCIDKIIFSACREYKGKVLYSTFSRGLLIDTESKVNAFSDTVLQLIKAIENNEVKYFGNHKIAVENHLGIYLDVEEDGKILAKLKAIHNFLTTKVDYRLIEDFYKEHLGGTLKSSSEEAFTYGYAKESYVQGQIAKLRNLSSEVIYKEIYGVIYGSYVENKPYDTFLSLEEYCSKRSTSFTRTECEVIYRLAKDFKSYLQRKGLIDNNLMSRELLKNASNLPRYSLSILDEVQDMTEINLALIKETSRKIFAVGDALQMINPSYFSFSYLKRLLYEEDVTDVKELKNNYRNTKKIGEIIESLSNINALKFGVHNFVLKGASIETNVETEAIKINGTGFLEKLKEKKYGDYTLIVASSKQKERARKILGNREILTVSEIKGLERDTAIIYNVLSDNYDKWETLERITVNRKTADENSVYRYYFNLLYVALSRAKKNVFVYEERENTMLKEFFKKEFRFLSVQGAVEKLDKILSIRTLEEDEILARIRKFVSLGQYENARIATYNLDDELKRNAELNRIDVNEKYVRYGQYREAGIRYWELALYEDAKEMFRLSKDFKLIEFMDASIKDEAHALSYDIVKFFPDLEGNDVAKKLILDTLKRDLTEFKEQQKAINNRLKALKEKK